MKAALLSIAAACGWLAALSLAAAGENLRTAPAQQVTAALEKDRVIVTVGGKLFTEYLFTRDAKYPYFFPVNAPRTGRTVTIRRGAQFPHHSSIFFGCDKVNGGNYWQEGLERGQIVSRDVRVVSKDSHRARIEQECEWQRPGAESPFDDSRVITISAPSADLRIIDFDVTLTARHRVRIERNNHSLFAARMAPELSVSGGGRLVNAMGAEAERGTFGKPSTWMHAVGTRDGETEGLVLFAHPRNRWHPAPWFTRDYGFLSPTPINWLEGGSIEFAPREQLRLRYRVIIHSGTAPGGFIEQQYGAWSTE